MEDQSVATGRSAVGNLIEQPRSKTKQNYARVGPMRNYARVGPMPSKKSYCIVILAIMAVVRGGGVLLRARVCGAGYSAQPPPPPAPFVRTDAVSFGIFFRGRAGAAVLKPNHLRCGFGVGFHSVTSISRPQRHKY